MNGPSRRRMNEVAKRLDPEAQARLKNIERGRSSIRRYRGKFKPKPALEKRLYRPEAKPSIND